MIENTTDVTEMSKVLKKIVGLDQGGYRVYLQSAEDPDAFHVLGGFPPDLRSKDDGPGITGVHRRNLEGRGLHEVYVERA